MTLPNGKLVSASFFWKNDTPGGLGFTFGPPIFSSFELKSMFAGEIIKDYIRRSDEELGSGVVEAYLDQLEAIASEKRPTMQQAILAAFNIIWLAERGFIPNNEFNGPQYVLAQE